MGSFSNVDRVVVTDVYAASEDPIEGVNSEIFTNELKEKLDIPCENIQGSIKEVAQKLFPTLKSGDVVIGLGAGTITNLGKELLELLGRKRGMLISGGEVNTERAAIMLLDEFRAGKTGCISLEKPEE